MQAYIVRRLLALIPTLFFASLIVFVRCACPGSVHRPDVSRTTSRRKVSRDQLIAVLASTADVGAIRPLDQRHPAARRLGQSLWQNTPSELLLTRLPHFTRRDGLVRRPGGRLPIAPTRVRQAAGATSAPFSILMGGRALAGPLVMCFPSIWWGCSPEGKSSVHRRSVPTRQSDPAITSHLASAVTMRLTRP